MRRKTNLFKQSARFLVLFISALTAHWISGGTFIDAPHLISEVLEISCVLAIFGSIELEGPKLALVVTLMQSTGHFVLGGGTYDSGPRMTLGHMSAGLISYCAISKWEAVWNFFTSFMKLLIPSQNPSPLQPDETKLVKPYFLDYYFQLSQLTSSLQFTGPPWKGSRHAS